MTRWLPEHDAVLRDQWAAGETASIIGHRIGQRTKNSVIGRAHRLGLPRHVNAYLFAPGPKAPRKRRRAPSKPVEVTIPVYVPPPAVEARMGAGNAIAALSSGQCRYPFGDPHATDFHFCTAPVNGGPYCRVHSAICYNQGGA